MLTLTELLRLVSAADREAYQTVINGLLAIGGISGVVSLLLIGPRRRRIDAGATKEQAEAAATLTGAAAKMVNDAQDDATKARQEAQAAWERANRAEAHARRAENRAERVEAQAEVLSRRLREAEDRLAAAQLRERDLERVLIAAGIDVPPRRRAGEVDSPDHG